MWVEEKTGTKNIPHCSERYHEVKFLGIASQRPEKYWWSVYSKFRPQIYISRQGYIFTGCPCDRLSLVNAYSISTIVNKLVLHFISIKVCHRGVVTYVFDRDNAVNEFEHQSRCNIHFWTNTFGKVLNLLIPPSYELNSTSAFFLRGWPCH